MNSELHRPPPERWRPFSERMREFKKLPEATVIEIAVREYGFSVEEADYAIRVLRRVNDVHFYFEGEEEDGQPPGR